MSKAAEEAYFSDICMTRCGGLCCDPWWGIISYTISMTRPGGAGGQDAFKAPVLRSIKERAARIVGAYVTKETPPRRLFTEPEVYNVKLRSVRAEGTTVVVELLAMYAFRCGFLTDENVCSVHPAVIGGTDIRPPHCGFMGSPEAHAGGKGYCRILDAATRSGGADGDDREVDAAVESAIGVDKGASDRHLGEGFGTAEEAAGDVAARINAWCEANMPGPGPGASRVKAGRNDPCPCGSGRKYKRCHGR